MAPSGTRTYRAFFSYARADERIANWLYRALDSYRTPRELLSRADVPAKLHPIFRDREDLSGSGALSDRLKEALANSDTLIVLCSPAAARSHWVNQEIETFLGLGRERSIFPVIASGEPDAADPAHECLPPALRSRGMLAADLREIRTADGRHVGDGREGGRLKLIAGLLGVPLDDIVRRERAAQRRRMQGVAALAVLFAALAVSATSLGILANQQRIRAENALAEIFADQARTQNEAGFHDLALRLAIHAARISHNQSQAARSQMVAALWAKQSLRQFTLSNTYDPIVLTRLTHSEWAQAYGFAAVLSPDGHRIAGLSPDGETLWNAQTGELIDAQPTDQFQVFLADFGVFNASANGLRACGDRRPDYGGQYATDVVWGAEPLQQPPGLTPPQVSCEIALQTPPGVAGRTNHSVAFDHVWRLLDTVAQDLDLGWDEDLSAAALSSDGHEIALGMRTGEVLLLRSAANLRSALRETSSSPLFMDVGGEQVFGEAGERALAVLRHAQITTLGRHDEVVLSLSFSADGSHLVSAGRDGVALLWDVADRYRHRISVTTSPAAPLPPEPSEWSDQVWSVASADGRLRATNRIHPRDLEGPEMGVILEDARAGHVIARLTDRFVNAISPDGRQLITTMGGDNAVGEVRDLQNADQVRFHFDVPGGVVSAAAFSDDGRRFATAGENVIYVWDAGRDNTLLHTLQFRPARFAGEAGGEQTDDPVRSMSFSHDGRYILALSQDDALRIVDPEQESVLIEMHFEGRLESATLSTDGNRLTTISRPSAEANVQDVEVWDVSSLNESSASLLAQACNQTTADAHLDPSLRVFSSAQARATQVVRSIWRDDRGALVDVCGGSQVDNSSRQISSPERQPARSRDAATSEAAASTTTNSSTAGLQRVIGVVAPDDLKVRTAPSPNAEIVGAIPANGSGIEVTGRSQYYRGRLWVEIRYGALSGWVNSQYLVDDEVRGGGGD